VGLFVSKLRLLPDEQIILKQAANLSQGARAVGGLVTVTDLRLIFRPHRFDALLGGRRLAYERTAIRNVQVAQPGDLPVKAGGIAGALRRTVVVATSEEQVVLLVNKPDRLVAALQEPPAGDG
jgi:hypothetical protein